MLAVPGRPAADAAKPGMLAAWAERGAALFTIPAICHGTFDLGGCRHHRHALDHQERISAVWHLCPPSVRVPEVSGEAVACTGQIRRRATRNPGRLARQPCRDGTARNQGPSTRE